MSTTYELCCDYCEVMYWCGQSSQGNGRLYDAEKVYKFLHQHAGHPLRFEMSEFAPVGYKQVEKEL